VTGLIARQVDTDGCGRQKEASRNRQSGGIVRKKEGETSAQRFPQGLGREEKRTTSEETPVEKSQKKRGGTRRLKSSRIQE